MKYLFLIFFSFLLNTSFSQKDKEKILANFDYIEYYPDSTIRSADKFTGVILERFTVEFDEIGNPVAMGNYKKGQKTGRWIYSDGSSDYFQKENSKDLFHSSYYSQQSNGDHGSMSPGCGTGRFNASVEFRLRYQGLIDPVGKEIKRKKTAE